MSDLNSTPPVADSLEGSDDSSESMPKQETRHTSSTTTYKACAKARGIKYTVTDVPPLGLSMLLGVQHYLTMLGATVLIPLILCPAMGATGAQTAQVISSIFFVNGINTMLQTTIGDR